MIGLADTIISRGLYSPYAFMYHIKHTLNEEKHSTSGVELPKNAEHACCIVSFFSRFHEARAVLQNNGVKTNISPRVLHHAENIMNNPLWLALKQGGDQKKKKKTTFADEIARARRLPGQTRRGFC